MSLSYSDVNISILKISFLYEDRLNDVDVFLFLDTFGRLSNSLHSIAWTPFLRYIV